ncbi:MAG: lytic transglycosylase domain-containing protein [Arenicella sp.]|nr:lytic transglycosylase domain-containing protein [Arenicella sp.]
MLIRNLIIATIALLGLSISGSVTAVIYVYEQPNGSTVITDSRIKKPGYKLKKSYSSKSYRSNTQRSPYRARTIKSKYDAVIVNTALKYDLEPSFIKAVIHVESAFDRYALSHAGAMGLMQLMPATASNYQLKQDHFNPKRNIDVGVQHIKNLMERYNSDKRLSLAAYNAGEGAVSKYNGVPPYEETQGYIIKVMRLYKLYKKEI